MYNTINNILHRNYPLTLQSTRQVITNLYSTMSVLQMSVTQHNSKLQVCNVYKSMNPRKIPLQ